MAYTISIFTSSAELPQLDESDFFHSTTLFRIVEETPGHCPFMVVAQREDGSVAAHLLACTRRRGSLLPPYLFTQGRIYGEGVYADDVDRDELFALLLQAVTQRFKRRLCLYAELSNISQKMFAYRHFRENGFFPVSWQEVHQSLHSVPPEERLSDRLRARIQKAEAADIETREAVDDDEIHTFYRLLRAFHRLKMRRFIPPEEFFTLLHHSGQGRVFVTLYKGKIIGGTVCAYSDANAYLCYFAARRKTYHHLHPETITIWHAINYAYEHNYAHIYFMDVGLPYASNPLREFLLSFGGKPVAKYRWFRIFVPGLSKIVAWHYLH